MLVLHLFPFCWMPVRYNRSYSTLFLAYLRSTGAQKLLKQTFLETGEAMKL